MEKCCLKRPGKQGYIFIKSFECLVLIVKQFNETFYNYIYIIYKSKVHLKYQSKVVLESH